MKTTLKVNKTDQTKRVKKMQKPPTLLFFGGKGGVGKTTIAASVALMLSRATEKKAKVIVISTDPAHSLGDSFETKIGPEVKKIDDNLYAVEISPEYDMQEAEKESTTLKGPLKDIMSQAGGLILPGIDEAMVLTEFVELMNEGEYGTIIFDTAPSGHTMRLLSMPDVMMKYLGLITRMTGMIRWILRMFRWVFGIKLKMGEVLESFNTSFEQMRDARSLLRNSGFTDFYLITEPEKMSILEGMRDLKVLRKYGIPVDTIIVNKVLPENDCEFCQQRREQQQKRIEEIRGKFVDKKIIEIPLFSTEIRGKAALEKIASYLDDIIKGHINRKV
jgi:arsenite-transporting ATPase